MKDQAAALCFHSDFVLEVMWVFLPKIHAPNRPRILQQDFTAVPVVCEQPGDSVSWSFLGVAQGSCALWCTGGSWARSPTKLNKNAQLALQGAPARWLDQPCPSRQRTWVLGYQHSRVCSRGGDMGMGLTARHSTASGSPGKLGSGCRSGCRSH